MDPEEDMLPSRRKSRLSVSKPIVSPRKPSSINNPPKVFQVNTYKMINGQYQFQGKYGLVLLSNILKRDFKIFIYASGNITISQSQITPNFTVSIARSLYASFNDSHGLSWSFLFNSTVELEEFSRRILIARFLTSNETSLVELNIDSGSSDVPGLQVGDSCDLVFSSWLVIQGELESMIDEIPADSPFTIQVGNGGGLEEALVGMKAGGHKYVVMTSQKAYGSSKTSIKLPPNSFVFFDITIKDTQHQSSILTGKNSNKPGSMADEAPLPTIPLSSESDKDSQDIHYKSKRTKKEKVATTNKDLLSRMAKIGSSLPKATKLDSDSSSDCESEIHKSYSNQQIPDNNKHETKAPQSHPSQSKPQYQYSVTPIQGYPAPPGNDYSNQQSIQFQQVQEPIVNSIVPYGVQQFHSLQRPGPPFIHGSQVISPNTFNPQTGGVLSTSSATKDEEQTVHSAMLVTEARQQNVEMRMAVSKLQDKVDKIFERILEDKNRNSSKESSLVPTMETSLLLQNLTRIIEENEHLKRDVYKKGDSIEKQKRKIAEILSEHHSFLEERNTNMEHTNESFKVIAVQSQSKVLALEEEKLKLAHDLSGRTAELYDLQAQISDLKKQESELRNRLGTAVTKLDPFERQLKELQITEIELRNQLSDSSNREKIERHTISELEQKLSTSEEKLSEVNQRLKSTEDTYKIKLTKALEEISVLKKQLEETHIQTEQQIETLRDKYRSENEDRLSDVTSKQSRLEQEITEYWKKRCAQQVSAERERSSREQKDFEEDRERTEAEIKSLDVKLGKFKDQTRSMKDSLQSEIYKLTEQIEGLEDALEAEKARALNLDEDMVINKIKSIMNDVFKSIKSRINEDKRYRGGRMHNLLIKTIRETTLSLTEDDYVNEDESESSEDDEIEEVVEKKEACCQSEQQPLELATTLDEGIERRSSIVEQNKYIDENSNHDEEFSKEYSQVVKGSESSDNKNTEQNPSPESQVSPEKIESDTSNDRHNYNHKDEIEGEIVISPPVAIENATDISNKHEEILENRKETEFNRSQDEAQNSSLTEIDSKTECVIEKLTYSQTSLDENNEIPPIIEDTESKSEASSTDLTNVKEEHNKFNISEVAKEKETLFNEEKEPEKIAPPIQSNTLKEDPLFASIEDDFLGGFLKKEPKETKTPEIVRTPPPNPLFGGSDDEDDMAWLK